MCPIKVKVLSTSLGSKSKGVSSLVRFAEQKLDSETKQQVIGTLLTHSIPLDWHVNYGKLVSKVNMPHSSFA